MSLDVGRGPYGLDGVAVIWKLTLAAEPPGAVPGPAAT